MKDKFKAEVLEGLEKIVQETKFIVAKIQCNEAYESIAELEVESGKG